MAGSRVELDSPNCSDSELFDDSEPSHEQASSPTASGSFEPDEPPSARLDVPDVPQRLCAERAGPILAAEPTIWAANLPILDQRRGCTKSPTLCMGLEWPFSGSFAPDAPPRAQFDVPDGPPRHCSGHAVVGNSARYKCAEMYLAESGPPQKPDAPPEIQFQVPDSGIPSPTASSEALGSTFSGVEVHGPGTMKKGGATGIQTRLLEPIFRC